MKNTIKTSDIFSFKVYKLDELPEGFIIPGYDHKTTKGNNHTTIFVNGHNYNFYYDKNTDAMIIVCEIIDKLVNNQVMLTNKAIDEYMNTLCSYLWIVNHDTNKLEGLNSLSTCCLDNMYCLDRIAKGDSICSHCYAANQQKAHSALAEHNMINGIILRNVLIPVKYWKKNFPSVGLNRFFRIESFGDTANKIQALNYIHFAKAVPKTSVAVWSKNHGIWHFAYMEEEKPKNMIYIASSYHINHCDKHLINVYGFIDHIFTVYTKEYAKENNIQINCGGRKCYTCLLAGKNCYFKKTVVFINELLK